MEKSLVWCLISGLESHSLAAWFWVSSFLSQSLKISSSMKQECKTRQAWDTQLKHLALSLAYRELVYSREACPASVRRPVQVALIVPTAQIPITEWDHLTSIIPDPGGKNLIVREYLKTFLVWDTIALPDFKDHFTYLCPWSSKLCNLLPHFAFMGTSKSSEQAAPLRSVVGLPGLELTATGGCTRGLSLGLYWLTNNESPIIAELLKRKSQTALQMTGTAFGAGVNKSLTTWWKSPYRVPLWVKLYLFLMRPFTMISSPNHHWVQNALLWAIK